MRKAFKKLLASLLALAMVCALAAPVFAATENLSTHTFEVYQIFTGTVASKVGEPDLRLSNADWGNGVNKDKLLAALAGAHFDKATFNTTMTPAEVVKEMAKLNDSDAIAFARLAYANKMNTTNNATVTNKQISFTEDGYYLIVDTMSPYTSNYNATNFSVLVLGKKGNSIALNEKIVKPSIEKLVEENNGNWVKNADHAINEKFQFKVVATLPTSTTNAYDYYEEYKAVITDILPACFTYDNNLQVTLTSNNTSISVTEGVGKDYVITEGVPQGQTGKSLTFTFENLKNITGLDLNKGATLEITYDAYLNEKAKVTTQTHAMTTSDNSSHVSLTYSSDPNNSQGDTAHYFSWTNPDYVYVNTYGVKNTKYADEIKAGNELAGATFALYKDRIDASTLITLNQDSADRYYFPVNGVGGMTEVASVTDGTFNFKGLDAGTYWLKEIKAPDGYNPCNPIEIKIIANLSNDKVDLTGSKNMVNEIVDQSGVVLPSTGGIGTTIFYVVGGLLMVGAAVLLVTKKRMENN